MSMWLIRQVVSCIAPLPLLKVGPHRVHFLWPLPWSGFILCLNYLCDNKVSRRRAGRLSGQKHNMRKQGVDRPKQLLQSWNNCCLNLSYFCSNKHIFEGFFFLKGHLSIKTPLEVEHGIGLIADIVPKVWSFFGLFSLVSFLCCNAISLPMNCIRWQKTQNKRGFILSCRKVIIYLPSLCFSNYKTEAKLETARDMYPVELQVKDYMKRKAGTMLRLQDEFSWSGHNEPDDLANKNWPRDPAEIHVTCISAGRLVTCGIPM